MNITQIDCNARPNCKVLKHIGDENVSYWLRDPYDSMLKCKGSRDFKITEVWGIAYNKYVNDVIFMRAGFNNISWNIFAGFIV